ncbi:MAG: hypothetical protein KGM99_18835 [Burkholderiales bacterium]|nr:hypothetical protein [Burkholderiales bacterium]
MNNNPQGRILVGAILLIFGFMALIDNLDIFNTRVFFHFWPMLFILIGALKISKSNTAGGYVIGGCFIIFGALQTLQYMGFIHFRMHDWWPVFLIAAGLIVILKDKVRTTTVWGADGNQQESLCNNIAIMSSNKVQNAAQDFRGGEITAIMGTVEMDLRNASILTDATMEVFAMWGGIVLKVPNDWTVIAQGLPILGGFEDKTVPPMMKNKRLIIKGYAVMGGVEIIN